MFCLFQKRGLLYKERNCSHREQFFLYRLDPFRKVVGVQNGKQEVTKVSPLWAVTENTPGVSIPLKIVVDFILWRNAIVRITISRKKLSLIRMDASNHFVDSQYTPSQLVFGLESGVSEVVFVNSICIWRTSVFFQFYWVLSRAIYNYSPPLFFGVAV